MTSSFGLLSVYCSQCLDGHTLHDYRSNVSHHCNHGRHVHLSNFLNIDHHILLNHNFFSVFSIIGGLVVVQQHIVAAYTKSLSVSDEVMPPIDSLCFPPRLLHASLVLKQLEESLLGFATASGTPEVLLTCRSFNAVTVSSIRTVSCPTMIEYVIHFGVSGMCPSATSQALHLKSSIFTSRIRWQLICLWPMGARSPSFRMPKATLTFVISFAIASIHLVSPFFASNSAASLTVFGISIPNLCVFFKYMVCRFFTR